MNKAFTIGWIVIMSALGLYELYALLFGHGKDWPLTWVTVKYVPKWVTLPFLGWLFGHFWVRYFDPNYLAKLGK